MVKKKSGLQSISPSLSLSLSLIQVCVDQNRPVSALNFGFTTKFFVCPARNLLLKTFFFPKTCAREGKLTFTSSKYLCVRSARKVLPAKKDQRKALLSARSAVVLERVFPRMISSDIQWIIQANESSFVIRRCVVRFKSNSLFAIFTWNS